MSVEKENLRFNPTRMASPQRGAMKTTVGTGFEITIFVHYLHDFAKYDFYLWNKAIIALISYF